MVGDSSGNVYVAGRGQKAILTGYSKNHTPIYRYVNHWIVRKSTNGGASWLTDDDFQLDPSFAAEPLAITADSTGAVHVAGNASDPTLAHGIIRSNAGGTWGTVDDDAENGGPYWQAIIADANGNHYAGGRDDNGWIIRESPAPAAGAAIAPAATSFSTASIADTGQINGASARRNPKRSPIKCWERPPGRRRVTESGGARDESQIHSLDGRAGRGAGRGLNG